MDNRLGQRIDLHLDIQLICTRPQKVSHGRLRNLSRSGALIECEELQLYSLIHVLMPPTGEQSEAEQEISAYVTRISNEGGGVEWCEFAPPRIAQLLQIEGGSHELPELTPVNVLAFEDWSPETRSPADLS